MNVQEHLLVCLAEECAEITHLCSKSLRFGLDDRNVLDPTGPTNRERLIEEINDFAAVLQLLEGHGLCKRWWNMDKQEAKKLKVVKFMDYAAKVGTLQSDDSDHK